ncbi:MAG TPA: shikimate dehydrogenase, partial [Spirochaetota bacterium]
MIDSSTRMYCIFGSPVRHSLSPVMHNAAFRDRGINAVYLAFEPKSGEDAILAMRLLSISGASVTIPFKTTILPFLDHIDPLAKMIGAVNTVRLNDGKLEGFNTDGIGAISALEESSGPIDGKAILLLGTGGSARAIACTLLSKGAHVTVAGRMGQSHHNLMNDLRAHFTTVREQDITMLTNDDISHHQIIINTTPLGMKDTDPLPVNADLLTPAHTVFDIVYHPHETPLLKKARERGASIIYGIEMLIRQGAAQFMLWTGSEPPIDLMRETITNA